jgi:hypothetical protein
MGSARTPAQIRQLIQHREDRGGIQKIRRKPKLFNPQVDKRNSDKNKRKESFGSEGV